MADTGNKLSTLAAELPSYTIVKEKCQVSHEDLPARFEALTRLWPEAKRNTLDGLRLAPGERRQGDLPRRVRPNRI